MDKTINNDTLVTSRAQDGREHESSDTLVPSRAQVDWIFFNNDTLVSSRAQDGRGTRK